MRTNVLFFSPLLCPFSSLVYLKILRIFTYFFLESLLSICLRFKLLISL